MTPNLNTRDKRALMIAGAAIAIFVIIQFILFPLNERHQVLKRQILAAEDDLEKMAFLKTQYDRVNGQYSLSGNKVFQNKDFNLFSVLEQYAGESGVKRHIAYMKPSFTEQKGTLLKLTIVEMKLETVTIDQLLQFLYRVETSATRININRMSITKTSKPEGFINAVLQVETLVEQ
ncbi:MAG: type II secretion system protein GspM [Desulfobacterales bacterium]